MTSQVTEFRIVRGTLNNPKAESREPETRYEARDKRPKSGHNILVMPKKSSGPRTPRGKQPGQYAAAEFKARCLELMDRVRETRVEDVITKHGKPVAKLVPVGEANRPSFLAPSKGAC